MVCKSKIKEILKELDHDMCVQEYDMGHNRLSALLDELSVDKIVKPVITDTDGVGTRMWVFDRGDADVDFAIREFCAGENFTIPSLALRFIGGDVSDVNKVVGMLGKKYLVFLELW